MSVQRTRKKEENEALINRRIEFLIREAKSEVQIPDQAITNVIRVLTNYFSVGRDVRSKALSAKCPCRSKEAHDLSQKKPETWLDEVTNEHQYPIKNAWKWMQDNRDKLTVRRVKNRLKKWPVVVVTEDETKELRKVDKESRNVRPAVSPDQRYLRAGINVLEKTESGHWRRRQPNQISD